MLESYWDPTGISHSTLTSMREHKGYLYLGGLENNRIGRIKLDPAHAIRPGRATKPIGATSGECDAMSFLTYLRRDLEQILFKDRDPHAIPSMDGAFSPNDRLDAGTPIGEPLPGADAVAEAAGWRHLRFRRQTRCGGLAARATGIAPYSRNFDGDVGALAFHPDGRLLACTERGLVAMDGAGRRSVLAEAEGEALQCLTAVAVAADGTHLCQRRQHATSRRRLVRRPDGAERARAASSVAGPRSTMRAVLLRGLNYPGGLAVAPDG